MVKSADSVVWKLRRTTYKFTLHVHLEMSHQSLIATNILCNLSVTKLGNTQVEIQKKKKITNCFEIGLKHLSELVI